MRERTERGWQSSSFRAGWPGISLALAGLLLTWDTNAGRGASSVPRPASEYAVKEVRGLAYYQGQDADPVLNKLNLFLPEGKKDYPILVLVHGGAWMVGDRSFFGWGDDLGRYFARQGFGVVMPSYRLSPEVRHPEHVKDLARALAWTVQNLPGYGGCVEKLFLCGHSAGGHLVSLLATDPRYLKAQGLQPSLIKGVISISGVYRIPVLDVNFTLPEGAASALRSLAGLLTPPADHKGKLVPAGGTAKGSVEVRLPLNFFEIVFGSDPDACRDASPLAHVVPHLPPFLLINADHDWPMLPDMTKEFTTALRAAKCQVRTLKVKDRDHEGVMFQATTSQDPVARAIGRFVRQHLSGTLSAPRKPAGP